jgi:hypothetical protein
VKYDKDGRFRPGSSEKAGNALGEFNLTVAVDLQGNIWVATAPATAIGCSTTTKPVREITNVGVGWTVCFRRPTSTCFFNSNRTATCLGRGTLPANLQG